MEPAAMYSARQDGATFNEIARVAGRPEIEVRAAISAHKAVSLSPAANGHDHMKENKPTEPAADISLEALVEEVNQEHRLATEAASTALEHAFRCGELLKKAKAQVGHGKFLAWLETNFAGSEKTAQNYMRLSSNPQRVADSYTKSIRAAMKLTNQQPTPIERAKEAWRANPTLSIRALVKKENIGHGTAQKARQELIAAGEISVPAHLPKHKPEKKLEQAAKVKPLIVEMFIGTCTVTNPLPTWRVIDDANRDHAQVVLCEDCKSYTMGAQPLGSFDEWFYECRCKNSRRDAVLERKRRQ